MDPPARARVSKFQPRAPPRKRNSLVAAPGIRGACIGRRIQEGRKTSISSLLRWRGSVDEIPRREGGVGEGEEGQWDIRYRGHGSRARPVRSDAGATLTWHVGRYQVLPRHRVDAERRRMCDSRSPFHPLAHPFRLATRLSLVHRVPLSPCRFPPYARAAPPSFLLVFARGEIHPCVVSPRRAPPLHTTTTVNVVALPPLSVTTSRRRISPWYLYYAANLL